MSARVLKRLKRRLNKSGPDSDVESSKQDFKWKLFQAGAPSAFALGWYPKINKDLPQRFYCPPLSLHSLHPSLPCRDSRCWEFAPAVQYFIFDKEHLIILTGWDRQMQNI